MILAASLVGALWLVYLFDFLLAADLREYGIRPRTTAGLLGILTAPFLHEGFVHLLRNSPALLVLLTLLFVSQPRAWQVLGSIIVLGGGLLWIFGRGGGVGPPDAVSVHLGASLVVFGLITFLIAAGLWHRRVLGTVLAMLVLFFYGGSLLWGVLPRINSTVSWDGHLCGAVAGIVVAWFYRDQPARLASSTVNHEETSQVVRDVP
jgi:membrane associated rhomboid family serine protease